MLCRLWDGWSKGGKGNRNPFPPFLSLGTFCNQKVPPPGRALGWNWRIICMGENHPAFPFRFRESNIAVATKTVVLPSKRIIVQLPTQPAHAAGGTPFLRSQKWGKDLPKRRSPSWISPPFGQLFALNQQELEKSQESKLSQLSGPYLGRSILVSTHT